MKWSTAVGHVSRLAEQCAEMADLPAHLRVLKVDEMWVYGDVLGPQRDLEWASAALCVDLPIDEVPWLCRPAGADRWAEMTRASKNPVGILWRSIHAPVWNHRVLRPVLVWDRAGGVRESAITAIRQGHGAAVGVAAPSEEEFVARIDDELRVSLHELQRRIRDYDTEHTTRLGVRADALYAAAVGYLDVLDAHKPDVSADLP
jgi:hypothetical protein